VSLSGFFVCPHAPDDACACRKPAPGLAHAAAAELRFEPTASFVIGDKPCDVDLGKRFGATTILVRTGYGEQFAATTNADHTAADLLAAAEIIATTLN